MTSILIARVQTVAARRMQADIEAARGLRVFGVAQSLTQARSLLTRALPEVVVSDLDFDDGAASDLLNDLRAAGRAAPRLLLAAASDDDERLLPMIRAGAGGYLIDASAVSTRVAVERLLRGEANLTAALALQILGFFGHSLPLISGRSSAAALDRQLDWSTGAADPLRLSAGESRLLSLVAQHEPLGGIAARMAISIESAGRRIANIYRKLQWDLSTGSLALQAA